MITITENALAQINELRTDAEMPYFRVAVQGGGCSGFQYHFDFDDTMAEDDFDIGNNILVDALSMQYLEEATLDYVEDLMGAFFNISNPGARTTCGCGSSFSV